MALGVDENEQYKENQTSYALSRQKIVKVDEREAILYGER
jgi:hypothetical protein